MADIYVSTSGNDTTGTGAIGTPYATPGKAGSVAAGGDRILIKAGTYTLASSSSNVAGGVLAPPAGTSAAPTRVVGYNATVGDLDAVNDFSNFPVLAASASFASAPVNCTNAHAHLANLDCNAASQASRAIWLQGGNSLVVNCRARNAASFGVAVDGSAALIRCLATGCGLRGYSVTATSSLLACVATANAAPGVYVDTVRASLDRCLIYGNTGASTDGLYVAGGFGPWVRDCVLFNNGRDGIRFNDATSGDLASVRNCVFHGNGAYGIRSATTTYAEIDLDFNAFGSNTSGPVGGVPAGAHDVTLSGDPFAASGSGNFALNSTAGAGAACRAAGFPGVLPLGLTAGYQDIGVQHQDAGGGGTVSAPPRPIHGSTWTFIG